MGPARATFHLYYGGTVPIYWGWVDNAAIDPNNPDRIFYGGVWSTSTTSGVFSAGNKTPSWTYRTRNLEESAVMALVAPPASASYLLVSAHGDVGGFVHTSLTESPSRYTDMYFHNTTGVDYGPYYSSNNGASWVLSGGLPVPAAGYGYLVAADRRTAGKFYAYDANAGKVHYSSDYGHTFTASASPITATTGYANLQSNPNAAGEVWITNGSSLYRSTDSGVIWNKVSPASVTAANAVALGKPATGSSYSAALYIVGTISGTYGFFRSDDLGATWTRINDDSHQFGIISIIAADQSTYGRVYLGTGGRGIVYNPG